MIQCREELSVLNKIPFLQKRKDVPSRWRAKSERRSVTPSLGRSSGARERAEVERGTGGKEEE